MPSITDNMIRNYNPILDPPLFNATLQPKPNYTLLETLSVDDTWHDLAKDRAGYNSTQFKNTIANYLMTNNSANLNNDVDNIAYYKNIMNGQGYLQTSGGTFENRVAKTFEIREGLQPANITVTYEDLFNNFTIVKDKGKFITFNNPDFFEKNIIGSYGSLILLPDITDSSVTYNNWISEYCSRRGSPQESDVNLKIATFIKWYMYGNYNKGTYNYDLSTLSSDSMKILFDGGQFHLKEISSVTGSGITPLLSTASVMDSANTSVGLLDPTIPVYFSDLSKDPSANDPKFHPMFSNYFTSNNLVTGYMINPGQTFGQDGTACFSFIIFLNDEQAQRDSLSLEGATPGNGLNQAINYIRTGERDQTYNTYIDIITAYVNAYPQKMARWYFGQIDKKSKSNDNDYYSACGVSGAGVSYIGQIFSILNTITNLKQGTNLITQIQTQLNSLKKLPTRTAIPISDARILNIFFNIATNSIDRMSILPKIPQLYGLMADYKREGDYNQIHEVLYSILRSGKNDKMFTFASGDELAALISRLCGIPTILQWSGGGRTTLYRSDIFSVDEGQRKKFTLIANNNIIKNFRENIIPDLTKITSFLEKVFPSLGTLCDQFYQIFMQIPITDNNLYIGYLSKFELLSKIISIYSLFSKANTITEAGLLGNLQIFINTFNEYLNISQLQPRPSDTELLAQSNTILSIISNISNDPAMTLYDDIIQQFPIIQTVDNIEDIVDYFTPLEDQGTFERKIFNLKFRDGLTKNKKLVALSGQLRILYPATTSRIGRVSSNSRAKDASQVKQSTKKYNELISEFPSSFQVYLVESLGETPPATSDGTGLFPTTLANIGANFFPSGYVYLNPQDQVTTDASIQVILGNIVPQLESSITQIKNSKELVGGKKKKYNLNFQKGGSEKRKLENGVAEDKQAKIQASNTSRANRRVNTRTMASNTVIANRRYCYNKIQSYVLKIFSKCNKFLLDTFNNVIRGPDAQGNPTVLLKSLAQLLTIPEDGSGSVFQAINSTDPNLNQQPLFDYLTAYITSDIMPNWQNIPPTNMLYMIILYYLAKYSDINDFFTNLLFNVGEDPENNGLYIQIQELSMEYTAGMLMDERDGGINQKLTMSDFLKILNLSYVRDLIMMLSIQIPDNSNTVDLTQYNSIVMDVVGGGQDKSFLPVQYQTLLQPNISSTAVLLLTLGIMNILYEGENVPQFNTTAYKAILPSIMNNEGALKGLINWYKDRPSALSFFGVTGAGAGAGAGAGFQTSTIQNYVMTIVMSVTGLQIDGTIKVENIWRGGKKTKTRKNKKHNKNTKNKNKNNKKDKKSKIKKIKKIKTKKKI
jgi:hypothetical protein